MRRAVISVCVLLLVVCPLAACGDEESTHQFSDIREHDKPRHDVPMGISPAERFGMRAGGRDPHGGGDPHGGAARGGPTFKWQTPATWEEIAPTGMRKGSWRVKGEPQTDCSLIPLGGGGGGLLANVNRWRGELGLDAVTDKEVAELPRRKLFGRDAVYLNLTGQYSGGRGGKGAIENARMLGLILQLPGSAIFLKFTGPAPVVESNTAAFESLADSVRISAQPRDPHAGGAMGGAMGGAGGATVSAPSAFTWDVPEGWVLQAPRMMRIATLQAQGDASIWCYASRLGGDAGGLVANVNRWRAEMGQSPLDAAAIEKLEHIDVLGVKSVVMKVSGDFRGTGGPEQAGATMFGVVTPRSDSVVFIKMVGPEAKMDAHYDRFIAFCTSLREK